MPDHSYFSTLIWQIADLLRGPCHPPQYERVMLPMTVLHRFDCVLTSTQAKALTEHQKLKDGRVEGPLDKRLATEVVQIQHRRALVLRTVTSQAQDARRFLGKVA